MSHSSAKRGFTLVELAVAIVIVGLLLCLVIPAVIHSREVSRKTACMNNLKLLAVALHNYHDAWACFPASSSQSLLSATGPAPGSSNADGNGAGYSRQTTLIPFVESNDYYDKLDGLRGYPYDGSANHALVAAARIAASRCPGFDGPDFAQAPEYVKAHSALTNYVAIGATHLASLHGTETRPIGGKNHPNGVMYPGSKTSFRHFGDGCTKTVVLTETKEQNYSAWIDGTTAAVVGLLESSRPDFTLDRFETFYNPTEATLTTLNRGDATNPTTNCYLASNSHSGSQDWGFGPSSNHPGVVNHAFADGSVKSVIEDIDPVLYMHLITRDGSEPTDTFTAY